MSNKTLAQKTGSNNRRNEGVSMIVTLVALVTLIGAAALAIDMGAVLTGRSQAQNAADAAALSAARNVIDKTNPGLPAVTLPAARTAAVAQGAANQTISNATVVIDNADIHFGNWDPDTATFDTGVDLTDSRVVTGVEVVSRLNGSTNSTIPAFMARVFGKTEFTVGARATAYLGFAGGFDIGVVDLPIAIDCCKLAGADCKQPYCAPDAPIPNSCDLVSPEDEGGTTVSCLEFHNTADQNACWTEFDDSSPSISTADLREIVEDGNEYEVDTSTHMYVDNGDKTPVIGEISDKFLGDGKYVGKAAGKDRYAPIHTPEQPDSWVVALPVVECQTDTHCAGGTPAQLVGVVCFELREVTVTPDKIIRGRFLCPTDPLFDECDLGPLDSGGLDFGLRADFPVLVR